MQAGAEQRNAAFSQLLSDFDAVGIEMTVPQAILKSVELFDTRVTDLIRKAEEKGVELDRNFYDRVKLLRAFVARTSAAVAETAVAKYTFDLEGEDFGLSVVVPEKTFETVIPIIEGETGVSTAVFDAFFDTEFCHHFVEKHKVPPRWQDCHTFLAIPKSQQLTFPIAITRGEEHYILIGENKPQESSKRILIQKMMAPRNVEIVLSEASVQVQGEGVRSAPPFRWQDLPASPLA